MNDNIKDSNYKIVYLSLGSNIEPSKNINTALSLLILKFNLLRLSSIWESASIGRSGPDFLNGVISIDTDLSADELKKNLRNIESKMGRARSKDKNAPRPIDIDILIYADKVLDEDIWVQPYLAIPLAEVYPSLINPESGITLQEIAGDLYKMNEIIPRMDVLEKHIKSAVS